MNGESSIEIYTLTYVQQIASGNLLWLKDLKSGLRDNLEGRGGVGGGSEVT